MSAAGSATLTRLALLGGVLALQGEALAWGEHYLLSDRAFTNPGVAYVEDKVAVEPLDAFLTSQAPALEKLFDDYYAWLGSTGSTRFKAQRFDAANPTLASFLTAARLNPETGFALVNRVMPGAEATRPVVEPSTVWSGLSPKPPMPMVFEDVTGQEVSGRSVLSTFADEPDWQMDRNLWAIESYGYGKQPYGKADGEGTKAPFHVQFMHENGLVRKFAPEMTQGMMLDRVELYVRLSRLAFASGHPYWGYRFAAWGTHYIQDLAQPYHARAVPYAGTFYYLRFAVSPRKDAIKTKTTAKVTNHHLLYEDFVAYGLMRSFVKPDMTTQMLSAYLASGDTVYAEVDSASELMAVVSLAAAGHGPGIDRALSRAYPPEMVKDPSWDIEKDPNYSVQVAFDKVDPERGELLLEETGVDFEAAGIASRTLLALARQGG